MFGGQILRNRQILDSGGPFYNLVAVEYPLSPPSASSAANMNSGSASGGSQPRQSAISGRMGASENDMAVAAVASG